MFTVVMPVRNMRDTVRRAVDSVLAQDWRDFELIVVDDGSTDDSIGALSGCDDDRVRIMRCANQGAGPARNLGIERATGEWIAFIDADDIWLPGHLAELDRLRSGYPAADLIGTDYLVSDLRNGIPPAAPAGGRIGIVDYFAAVGRGLNLFCASSAAIPKGTYARHGGFLAETPGQDTEYWARIALAGTVAVSTRFTSVYVQTAAGTTLRDLAARRGSFDSLRSLSLSVEMLSAKLPLVASPRLRRNIEDYIETFLHWRLLQCAAARDVASLRKLDLLALKPRRIENRLYLSFARLPESLARPLLRAMLHVSGLVLRLRRLPGSHAYSRVWQCPEAEDQSAASRP